MTFLVKIINKLGNKINKLVRDNIIALLDETGRLRGVKKTAQDRD
jgi:predicted house-cleaning noncanonical NTP pyrophosphatase (MazG superfamily)